MLHSQVIEQINKVLILYSSKPIITPVSSFCYTGLGEASKFFLLRAGCFHNHIPCKPVDGTALHNDTFLLGVI